LSFRLIQVSPYSWDAPGGVQNHILQLSAHLRRRGHEVLILAPGDHARSQDGTRIIGGTIGINWNGSVARISLGPRSWSGVRRALREFQPDVIHVHEPFAPGPAMFAVLYANAPVVSTFHSYYEPGRFHSKVYAAMAPFFRPVWNRIDQRIAVSEAARMTIASRMTEADIRIVPNGADVGVFAGAAPAPLPPGRTLLFVGRLEPRKGFSVAVDAFARLATAHPDVRLVVVGDGEQRSAVEALEPAIRRRVDMVGRVSAADLPGYHRAAGIFLAPSTGNESFGIVLVEAMAAGLPIVASDIAGYRAVTRHESEGLLVPPGDAAALAAAIDRLLRDPTLARSLGARGAERAKRFDWSVVGEEVEKVYEELTAQRKSRV
jgi:phosphatidyl-myo-inositol alpha-mannosyltransferase